MTTRVVGIGGVFFKARDPEALGAWYHDHLGLAIAEHASGTPGPRLMRSS